ncbi:MAG: PAS domain S-box protein, partial [Betaproteobacteria bacterium]|nr:PAS domain S-box protein [Betaproteobacteria bacterium]
PVMDGFSLCWEWKRDERLKRIPLICYTGTYTDGRNRQFALELGAERFVVNTGNPEDLVKVIREVLEMRKRGGPAAVPPDVAEKTVYLKRHNELLARKLEDKMRQLEQAYRGLQRDIAERKRAEETQARLAAIVEHSNDAIIGRALDGTITAWNAAAERILGYTAAEAIGRELTEIQPPELRPEIAERRKLLLAGQPGDNGKTVRIAKDGRRIEMEVSGSPIKDHSGSIIGTAAIFRDISDRKRTERELQHKTEIVLLLEQLARAANEAVSPEAAMEICLRRICENGDWVLGRVASFQTAELRSKPEHSQWFCMEPARFDAFMRYSDHYEFTGGYSVFSHRVLRDRCPVWLPDLTALDTARLTRLAMAAGAGLKAAFAFPVIVAGEVAAFLEFFATETRQPDALLMEAVDSVASQFARMIERSRATEVQARLAAIVEYSNDAIIGRAIDGTITSWNAAAERILGYTAAEVVGRDPVEIFPLELRQVIAEHRKLLNAGQLVPEYETVRIHKDGRRVDVAASVSAIKDNGGSIIGIAAILRDITGRKQAEETQAKLSAIVEHSSDAIIGRTLDRTIISWNAAAERILGYTAAEVMGRDLVEIYPPEVRQEIAERRKLIRTGQPVPNHESVRITKDGRRVDVAISTSQIKDHTGRVIGTASLLRDISERKRAERILRNYTARLQTVSRKLLEVQEDERRRLARELHDQVGQVLTALKINLQVIERQPAAAPVASTIAECAQIADAALQQVRTLMLDLRPPQLDELGLAAALRTHAERMVAPANLALHFSAPAVPPKTPPAIEIVCFRITQEALTNILRHAGARNVWIELAVAGDGLELTVRDDGKGFDLAEAHRRAVGGGSIGLLSMEERAVLADGRVEISTAPGAGTTVRAMFSLQAAQAISSS